MTGTVDWTSGEPALEEVLQDPIVVALMRRDSVAPQDVTAALRSGQPTDEAASLDDEA